ncbi:MAG: SMI1/KNR4 family protein [Pirellulaceae bacterium]
MSHIVNSRPAGPASESEIAVFETMIGHSLPEDYRRFLLEHNGGSPRPDAFTFNLFGRDEENIVMCFFPLRDLSLGEVDVEQLDELRTWPVHCAWNDLQHDLLHLYEKEIEHPLLPIGTDGSGNYFCIVLSGPQMGAMLFHEHELAETCVLASSFDEFLTSLRPRVRKDYAEELEWNGE